MGPPAKGRLGLPGQQRWAAPRLLVSEGGSGIPRDRETVSCWGSRAAGRDLCEGSPRKCGPLAEANVGARPPRAHRGSGAGRAPRTRKSRKAAEVRTQGQWGAREGGRATPNLVGANWHNSQIVVPQAGVTVEYDVVSWGTSVYEPQILGVPQERNNENA